MSLRGSMQRPKHLHQRFWLSSHESTAADRFSASARELPKLWGAAEEIAGDHAIRDRR
jgi:hypothetical protein